MATRRYFYVLDSSQPLRWVDRYLANASLEQRTTGLALAYQRGPEQMAAASPTNANIREAIREQAALTARLAAEDLFAPSKWAVESASLIEAHPEAVSERMRAFFQAPHTNTDQLVLCADREGALEALAAARAVSMAEIGAMEPAPQAAAVGAMWSNFALYFQRLGVRVNGWAKWRSAVAQATGCDDGQDSVSGFLLSPYLGQFPEGYDLMFRARPTGGPASPSAVARVVERLSQPRPTAPWSPEVIAEVHASSGATLPPNADTPVARSMAAGAMMAAVYREANAARPPSWRSMTQARYAAIYGGAPSQVFFGSKDEVEAAGHSVYRLWINDLGWLVEGDNDPAHFDRLDCVMRDGGAALPAPRPGFNWMCGAISRDAQGRCYYLAPLFWYAQLLQPLLAYLATRDPLEVAYEVLLDVLGKNLWTTIATGRGESALAQLGAGRPIANAADAAARFASFQRSFSTTIATVAGTAALINPAFGAIVGLGGAALGFFATATQPAPPRPASDCFFRFEPVVEYLQIREGNTRAWQCSETDPPSPVVIEYHGGDALPAPRSFAPLSYLSLPTVVPSVMQIAPTVSALSPALNLNATTTPPRLRISGLPPYAATYIDGVRTDDSRGRWEGDAWVIPGVTAGTHTLRAVPRTPAGVRSGTPRVAAVAILPHGPSTIPWSVMREEAPPVTAIDRGAAKRSVAAPVAIGVVALVAIGTAVYFATRKAQKPAKRNGRRRAGNRFAKMR